MERVADIGKMRNNAPCDKRDEALIRSVLAGDASGFRTLYDRHSPRIHSFLYWNTKTAVRAEELTQDVFVKAWEKLHTFGFRSAFSTWLFGIAINHLKTDFRKRSREVSRFVPEPDLEGREQRDTSRVDPGTPETSAPGRKEEEVFDLRRAIGTLPDKARQVLTLYEFQNYTHKEIAALLHISPGTSKAHLSRAKSLLRKEMEA